MDSNQIQKFPVNEKAADNQQVMDEEFNMIFFHTIFFKFLQLFKFSLSFLQYLSNLLIFFINSIKNFKFSSNFNSLTFIHSNSHKSTPRQQQISPNS